MKLAGLDDRTIEEINGIQDFSDCYAFRHSIIGYGVDAIAHFILMRGAKEVIDGKVSLEEYVGKYQLRYFSRAERSKADEFSDGRFTGSINSISDEIFIPRQRLSQDEFQYFKADHCNALLNPDTWTTDPTISLARREWALQDFRNPEIVSQGVQFATVMWNICVMSFERFKEGVEDEYGSVAQSQERHDLGRKLVSYYYEALAIPKSG